MEINKHDPPETRFWARVDKDSSPAGCWLWTGGTASAGYGIIGINYKSIGVHRFSYALHNGPIPDGMFVCHHCDNPACVNPAHLFLGTPQDNMDDMASKGRAVHSHAPRLSGESHPNSKLTQAQVDEMRSLYATGEHSIAGLATRYNVTRANVSFIVKWRTWRTKDSPPPEFPGRAKLTADDVRAIRRAYATGKVLQRELAAQYNVTGSLISSIVSRRRWSHIT